MLPRDEFFLAALQATDLDGGGNTREKEMLLTTLRFYFGPAQGWGAVHNVSDAASLAQLDLTLRQPGERYEVLEQQTSLSSGYFSQNHSAAGQVALYVARKDNNGLSPSYFIYEASRNLTLYVGPDLLHNLPGHLVANALVLDGQYCPVESFTLRF
ncbi:hypothetical protein [Lacipirellula parvula]|uniref:Uncharacterized protein n=1 Tax=Lacipirellula parvula TaxID=2650471 RepID=A0A5K7XFK4_9BACT|nr:hypothetical protein [Lacipirellula parvula]BBO35590.1 hypothetical protein PLANPX_5202 [Lacipirellula parvula]